jgi:hypothetical protein
MTISLGFDLECIVVALDKILPSRKMPEGSATSRKMRQIRSSIEEVGLIEPLAVTPAMDRTGKHMLLDGHIRLAVLRDMGAVDAQCLLAKDDEGYTYNNRINRLSTVQEHAMIRRAIDRGVSAERLAKALNMDIGHLNKKARLLDGICSECRELLRDRVFAVDVSRFLRQMKPTRQVECVELMLSANNLTKSYAEAMLVATAPDQLADGGKRRKSRKAVSHEQMLKMEREMACVQSKYKSVEQSYGQDVLNLVLARGYLVRLLGNTAVVRYLKERRPDVLAEFETVVKSASVD